MQRLIFSLALAAGVSAIGLFTPIAQAGDTKVNCNSPGANGKIANALSRLDPQASNVVHVRGSCHENLVIQGFDQLSLVAEHGAAIEDASGGQLPTVEIRRSQLVAIEGFRIHGGRDGVLCGDMSSCRLTGLTVEDTQAGSGITFDGADGTLTRIVVHDALNVGIAFWGATIVASDVSIDGVKSTGAWPNGAGMVMSAGSVRNGPMNGPIAIQNADGPGIQELNGSIVDVSQLTLTYNGWGIWLANGATATIGQLTAENNKIWGIVLDQGSNFNLYGANSVIRSNGAGIYVAGGASLYSYAGTTVTGNHTVGIQASDGARVYLGAGTTVADHQVFGISVFSTASVYTLWRHHHRHPTDRALRRVSIVRIHLWRHVQRQWLLGYLVRRAATGSRCGDRERRDGEDGLCSTRFGSQQVA